MAASEPRRSSHRPEPSGPDRRPLLFLLLITGLLTARWVWIAGLGDYGWTYELGMRVLRGEVPYRDYISTLPQLTSYTIVPFLVLLKGNLWAFSLHLYSWWFATLLVGLKVAQAFGLCPIRQTAAILLAACLSLPATHLGHAYSYAGTFFFGLTLLQLIRHRNSPEARRLVLAGVFAGCGIFAKQNIGIVTGLLGLTAIVLGQPSDSQRRLPIVNLFLFGAGAAISFLTIFALFAAHAGGKEVFQQMFSDAGEGKGGLFGMIFHALPLFFFTPETPLRQLWTLLISGGLGLLFFGLIGNKLYRMQMATQPSQAPVNSPRQLSWKQPAYVVGIVAVLSTISLFDLPAVRNFCNRLHPSAIHEFHGYVAPAVFVAYSFFTALAAISLFSREYGNRPELLLPILALPLILWGHEISCQGYLPFGAPLVVPLAMILLERIGFIRNIAPPACFAAAAFMLLFTASTQNSYLPSSFKKLEQLPADSKFAHLWARPDFAQTVAETKREVAPNIQGEPTLWLTIGGPHLAWGGTPVFAVGTLFGDTYNRRSEPILLNRWRAQPPQFIYVGHRNYCFGSQLFTDDALNQWLPEQHELIWKNQAGNASLWKLRKQPTEISP